LSPISEIRDEEKQPQKEDADPVWEQTRRDIFEPQEERKSRKRREEEKYDAKKVENLKTNLINSLKHATNIQNLKPDESVIITITGSDDSSSFTNIVFANTTSDVIVKNKKSTRIITPSSPLDDRGSSSPTVLVIRAKKSDIDEFSNDELDFDQFRQRVQIFMQ